MTRRTFFGTIGVGLAWSTWAGTASGRGQSRRLDAGTRDAWTVARDIVRSGELGTILWGHVTVPPDEARPDRTLQVLLGALGLQEPPRRVATLTAGGPSTSSDATTIVEFASGPPVYVAPGPHLEWTIRGTRSRLHVAGNRMRVVACQA